MGGRTGGGGSVVGGGGWGGRGGGVEEEDEVEKEVRHEEGKVAVGHINRRSGPEIKMKRSLIISSGSGSFGSK